MANSSEREQTELKPLYENRQAMRPSAKVDGFVPAKQCWDEPSADRFLTPGEANSAPAATTTTAHSLKTTMTIWIIADLALA